MLQGVKGSFTSLPFDRTGMEKKTQGEGKEPRVAESKRSQKTNLPWREGATQLGYCKQELGFADSSCL